MKRVVVFGATGQIGYALCRWLHGCGQGYQVRAVKRESSPLKFPEGIEILSVPSLERSSLERALSGADYAVYAIGSPEQWHPDREYFSAVNVGLLKTFLECKSDFPDLPFAYVSTFEVFSHQAGRVAESNPEVASGATPYYQSMLQAYRITKEFEAKTGSRMASIHPAAVYGGLNTGRGFTDFLWNLRWRKFWKVPCIPPGAFPLVHVDSLAAAIELIIRNDVGGEGFLVSDVQISLKELALAAKTVYSGAYLPKELPLQLVNLSVSVLESVAALTGNPPIFSRVQIKYVTQGLAVDSSKAKARLGWSPLGLEEGIGRLYRQADYSGFSN